MDATTGEAIAAQARQWVEGVRAEQRASAGVESFLHQYDLSTQEGVLLMCVAEALLRIPDADTADLLIRDKLARGDWEKHLGASESLLVNASTWGLMLTGRLTRIEQENARDPKAWYERIVSRAGEPVVRVALRQAMKVMAEQFVMGRTIAEALARSRQGESARYRHSYDMLGEAALTTADAQRYLAAYADAIAAIGASVMGRDVDVFAQPSISVKLSALHPRYEFAQRGRVLAELVPALAGLARRAGELGIGMTIDAEESRAPRAVARSVRAAAPRHRARRLAGAGTRGAGVPEARAARRRMGRGARARGAATASRCASSRARTGTPRSSARRCRVWRAIRCSRARRTPTSRTWRARARCSRRATRSIRCSRRTTRTPSPGSKPARTRSATRRSSSSACTAWARRCTRR